MERGGNDGIDHEPETGANAIVVAEDVSRRYGETSALDGVSCEIERGEVFCLIGPNGAGKTTFVRALTGTTEHGGEITVFGSPPTEVDRSRVGLLPQEFTPTTRLTARELLAYYAGLYDDAHDPDGLLADLGLEGSADTRYEDLSGGQRRRVCVGTALVNDPELLFLDEPTTGIDPAGRRDLWRLLEALVASGTTIFLTTHDMAEAERLADRVGLLSDGRLAEVDSPEVLVATHGGESRLTVDVTEPSDGANGGARALADAGYRIARHGNELVVSGVQPEAIGRVVRELDERGVKYEGLTWGQPTLEDAYLELTGTAVGRGGDPIDPDPTSDSGSIEEPNGVDEADMDTEADTGTEADVGTDAGTTARPGGNR